MSKFLGKLLCKSSMFDIEEFAGCKVRYLKGKNRFEFIVSFAGGGVERFSVDADLLHDMLLVDKNGGPDFFYKFSVGYAKKERVGVESINSVRKQEMELLGGRTELIMSGAIDSDYEFDLLCVIMFVFNISVSILSRVRGANSKRHIGLSTKSGQTGSVWVELQKRDMNSCCGRKKGSLNRKDTRDVNNEALEELTLRAQHNMQVALNKNSFAIYFENAKILDPNISKDLCLKKFLECRKMLLEQEGL